MRSFIASGGLAVVVGLGASGVNAELIYGLTNLQQLVTFDSTGRTVVSTVNLPFSITGEILQSIDVRPANNQLYGLSSTGQIYVINTLSGAVSPVGTPQTLTGNIRNIDFNPVADRIRLITTSGQNLRINPDTGVAIGDGPIAFGATDPNAGDVPLVVASAYTNSFRGATSTTLFNIEAGNDIVTTQVPPNNGTQVTPAGGGAIGFNIADSSGFTGFDISGATGSAYLVGNNLFGGLTVNSLYSVNLTTGAASLLGAVSGVNGSFRDIAVTPEPATLVTLGGAALLTLRRRSRH